MSDNDELSFLGQPRDDAGRFAAKSEPAPAVEPAPPPPVEPSPPASQQPASAVPPASQPAPEPQPEPWKEAKWWDEKEKRQQRERELEEAKRERDELRRKLEDAARPQAAPIDPVVDPEGYHRSIEERLAQQQWDTITRLSRLHASRTHGPEQVAAAEAWLAQEMQSNPGFFSTIRGQEDPYDFVVRAHKRSQTMARIGDDPFETAAEKWARENGFVKVDAIHGTPDAGAPSPQSPVRPPPPRPSIASAPAASPRPKSDVMQSEDEAFSEVFSRKR